MKLISGSSNVHLAQSIAHNLGLDLIETEISQFSNGEKRVWIKEDIRSQNVALVQSFSHPTDEHIMEFLLLTDALERMGARHVNAVIPWMGYSLQDKVFRGGEPISAKVVANLVSNAYIKRAFLLDLHNTSTPGFFAIPTSHLSALGMFAEYVKQQFDLSDIIIASPDFGGLKRARVFADMTEADLVNIDKTRNLRTGEVTAHDVHGGSVDGKKVVLMDDCIVSGGTVVEAAELLKEKGATEVHFLATHGLFCGGAFDKLANPAVDSIVVTNSIFHVDMPEKIKTLDAAPLFAEHLRAWV